MPNPIIRTSLNLHPEIARLVGLVVAEYAVIERLMYHVYALIVDDPPIESFKRFYRLRSLHLKKELVLTSAKKTELHPQIYNALFRLWRRFSAAADRRTEIAHCTYLSDGKTIVRLRIVKDAPKYEKTTQAIFERTFNQYHILGIDLEVFQGFVARTTRRSLQVVRVLPRAPQLQTPLVSQDFLRPPTKFEEAEVVASLSRLKLSSDLLHLD